MKLLSLFIVLLFVSACGQPGAPTPTSMLFVGDSITARANWESFFPGDVVKKCARSGQTSTTLLALCRGVPAIRPDLVFVMWGTNDIATGASDETVLENYRAFIEAYRGIHVVVQSVLPTDQARFSDTNPTSRIVRLNAKLRKFAEENTVTYLDLFDYFYGGQGGALPSLFYDGEHPNAAGYVVWVNQINQLLNRSNRS